MNRNANAQVLISRIVRKPEFHFQAGRNINGGWSVALQQTDDYAAWLYGYLERIKKSRLN